MATDVTFCALLRPRRAHSGTFGCGFTALGSLRSFVAIIFGCGYAALTPSRFKKQCCFYRQGRQGGDGELVEIILVLAVPGGLWIPAATKRNYGRQSR